jgi:hypothetical protein
MRNLRIIEFLPARQGPSRILYGMLVLAAAHPRRVLRSEDAGPSSAGYVGMMSQRLAAGGMTITPKR